MKAALQFGFWFGGALFFLILVAIGLVTSGSLTEKEIESISKLIAGFGLVAGAAWAVVSYVHSKKLEFQRHFNDRQVETILLTAETVGNLLSIGPLPDRPNENDWDQRKARFWELYWGRLVLFEDEMIITAMVDLGEKLKHTKPEDRRTLERDVYAVSLALREFLKTKNDKEWQISFANVDTSRKKNTAAVEKPVAGGETAKEASAVQKK